MHARVVVTLAGVAPVENQRLSVRRGDDVHPAEEGVGGDEGVGAGGRIDLVFEDVAAALFMDALDVHAAAVEVERQQLAVPPLWPRAALIDHHAAMRVPSAVGVGRAGPGLVPLHARREVPVVGVEVDQLIRAAVRVQRERPRVVRPRDHVPQVAVDRVAEKQLSLGVPVVPPGVARAVAENFDAVLFQRVPPDAAFEGDPLLVRRAGLTDAAGTGTSTTAVQPAVRPPLQAVGEVVIVGLGDGEAVQDDLRLTVRHEVHVSVRHEQQPRRTHQPNAAGELAVFARRRAPCVSGGCNGRGLFIGIGPFGSVVRTPP